MTQTPLFDEIAWKDPAGDAELEPVVSARTPAGVPVTGALRIAGTGYGYPIVDSVARLTPELAARYRVWLEPLGLEPPPARDAAFQREETVDSFGFQWSWAGDMRSEADLQWRVARQFGLDGEFFAGKRVVDAGAGAGDQSRWLVRRGASALSVDLSGAIEVVARKLRLEPRWFGVQGDITRLPLRDGQFDVAYCEGVIQHTRDSAVTVAALARLLAPGGVILATHYERPFRRRGKVKKAFTDSLRRRLSRWDRYKLLLLTGNMAAAASIPLVGKAVRVSGAAMYHDLMPDFKTTWTNTFDWYGTHAHQRHLSSDEFWQLFEAAGGLEPVYREGMRVVARRTA
jgi:SAM-dependent methyltransferase